MRPASDRFVCLHCHRTFFTRVGRWWHNVRLGSVR
jgi:hypothetical protein